MERTQTVPADALDEILRQQPFLLLGVEPDNDTALSTPLSQSPVRRQPCYFAGGDWSASRPDSAISLISGGCCFSRSAR